MSTGRLPRSIAITGLGTLVGGRIAERLLDAESAPRVIAIDLELPRPLEGRLRLHPADLTDPTADSLVAEILEKEGVEAVLHAAFFTDPQPDREYAHELEMIGSLHVMNAAAAAGVRKLVVMSTAQVYGARPDNPHFLEETHALRPPSDAHQLRDRAEVESLLELFASRHPDMCVTSLRPCWTLGPGVEGLVSEVFSNPRVFVPQVSIRCSRSCTRRTCFARSSSRSSATHPARSTWPAPSPFPSRSCSRSRVVRGCRYRRRCCTVSRTSTGSGPRAHRRVRSTTTSATCGPSTRGERARSSASTPSTRPRRLG